MGAAQMSRRHFSIRPKVYAGAGMAFLLALVLVVLAGRLAQPPPGLPPAALEKIADKNRAAAAQAAAVQRAESAASVNAAEGIREAQDRGRAEAEATIARFDDDENLGARAGEGSN